MKELEKSLFKDMFNSKPSTKDIVEKIAIKTLEEIHYANLYCNNTVDSASSSLETEIVTQVEVPVVETAKVEEKSVVEEFKEKHFVVEEEQIGITYEKLFGQILKGAKHIEIVDPYIRNFFQTLNLMEFLEVVEKCKSEEEEVTVELTTSIDEFNEQIQNKNLETIRESCMQMGIDFSYKYDATIHARSITTDNGWKILLDRGLDIYQNCERKDAFHFTTRVQKYRPCKRFEITYLKNNK